MKIISNFEGGAIEFCKYNNEVLYLNLVKNNLGEVNHWFYFGIENGPQSLKVVFNNGMKSRFSNGWNGYSPFISYDNVSWKRVDSKFQIEGDFIHIDLINIKNNIFLSWFPPYTTNKFRSLTKISDYILEFGNKNEKSILITARHHPGETMGSYFLEGFINYMKFQQSSEVLKNYNFIIVPFVNIQGVKDGLHRTDLNGIDYNFAWYKNKIDEISLIKERIKNKDLILYFDIHGDEVSKINYIYYTGQNYNKIKSLLTNLRLKNNLSLFKRTKLKYILKVLIKKRKLIRGIKNTVEYIEKRNNCSGFVYELSAHINDAENCVEQGKNFGIVLQEYLKNKNR